MPQKLQSKTHRERAQPSSRARLGLLEKKSDYLLRARNFHSKTDRLKKLAVAARERNPDEFNFGMISSRIMKNGEHRRIKWDTSEDAARKSNRKGQCEGGVLSEEVVRLLKSQDRTYLSHQLQVNKAKLDQERISLACAPEKTLPHLRFVEDIQEGQQLLNELAGTSKKASITTALNEEQNVRLKRVKQLTIAIRQLDAQKAATEKGRKEKMGVDADGVPIYKFLPERKK